MNIHKCFLSSEAVARSDLPVAVSEDAEFTNVTVDRLGSH